MNNLIARKRHVLGAALAAVVLTTAGCGDKNDAEATKTTKPAEVKLETAQQKVTYIVGYNMAKQAQSNGLEFQTDVMVTAIQDVLSGKEPRIAQEDQQKIMMSFQEEQQAKREEERKQEADTNLEASKEYLAKNAEKEGVVTTESGLQYEVLKKGSGDGESPTKSDKVKVHYHGTLVDGTVFDSSVDRGQPVTFPVRGVIDGWVEALELMKEGDKFRLAIPPELAYGETGTSGVIGPNAALLFDVELLEINPSNDSENPHGDAAEEAAEEGQTEEAGAE